MKTILVAVATVICLSAALVSAQMMPGGEQGKQHPGGGMMGSQPSQMMGGQMMTQQDMMRDMMGMMGQMDQVMQKMSRGMEGQMPMDRMQKMSGGMAEMSVTMKQMSEHMTKGSMDHAAMQAMQERMKNLNQMMDDLSKQVK